ncbi:MAG: Gfo/Idh/MocA family protein [Mangrovibacterium sp.]
MRKLMKVFLFMMMPVLTVESQPAEKPVAEKKPIRLAVAGMSHGHISFILGRPDKGDFKLVGVAETNQELVGQIVKRYQLPSSVLYDDLEKMLDETKPEAVVAFGSVYDHLKVVEACAPRGIHVMVEKPLAVSVEHARRMAELARKYKIHLLTDYETSWYPTTALSFQLVDENFAGSLRKAVFHDGHQGPKEIGCDKFFLEWLTDPVLNGGGALTDFGCYGANLMTALTKGEEPLSVTAVTRQFKPGVYPKVDDDATIIVQYPTSQCIIQASWNWPFSRKDMEIYGDEGYIITIDNQHMRRRNRSANTEMTGKVTAKEVPVYEDPFSCFADVLNGKISLSDYDPYSLENNLLVVRILEAARESAKTGKTVFF